MNIIKEMAALHVVCVSVFFLTQVYAELPSTPTGVEDCNSFEAELLNDGYHKCVNHSTGTPVIGVGFNLTADGAQKEIEAVGADYGKVLDGKECLNDTQIKKLFKVTMDTAIKCASTSVDNYNCIGKGPQSAIADMAFNMGCDILWHFFPFKDYIEQKDFKRAAQDLNETLWCEWVGTRCTRDINCILSGGGTV